MHPEIAASTYFFDAICYHFAIKMFLKPVWVLKKYLLCKAFYWITLIKCQNRTKIFSLTHFIFYTTTIPWDNVWLSLCRIKSIIDIRSLEIRLRLWKKCWLHCECIQIARTFARKLCNCRWIKIRRELEKLEEKHWYATTKNMNGVCHDHSWCHALYKHNFFSNFSCMFLNPNIFFQFEVWLF